MAVGFLLANLAYLLGACAFYAALSASAQPDPSSERALVFSRGGRPTRAA